MWGCVTSIQAIVQYVGWCTGNEGHSININVPAWTGQPDSYPPKEVLPSKFSKQSAV